MDSSSNQIIFPFIALLVDILRLPEETKAMTYTYIHRYRRFYLSNPNPEVLDLHTLALASLSLATKATEAPRRLRAIISPAFHLLHPREDLEIPSTIYDRLRQTIVRSEMLLLRILKFELRISLPLSYLPRYLGKLMGVIGGEGVEDYEGMGSDRKAEYQVLDLMLTSLGQECRSMALQSCQNYQLSSFWPPRAVAAGCVLLVAEQNGIDKARRRVEWIETIAGKRKVDATDVDEIIQELKDMH